MQYLTLYILDTFPEVGMNQRSRKSRKVDALWFISKMIVLQVEFLKEGFSFSTVTNEFNYKNESNAVLKSVFPARKFLLSKQ